MIIGKRGFFNDVEALTKILIPIKKAILRLESRDVNLADCYVELLCIGATYQSLSSIDYSMFKNYCIRKYNERLIQLYILLNYLFSKYSNV
jgi:hypothetical protein